MENPNNISGEEWRNILKRRRIRWTRDNAFRLFTKFFPPLMEKKDIQHLREVHTISFPGMKWLRVYYKLSRYEMVETIDFANKTPHENLRLISDYNAWLIWNPTHN